MKSPQSILSVVLLLIGAIACQQYYSNSLLSSTTQILPNQLVEELEKLEEECVETLPQGEELEDSLGIESTLEEMTLADSSEREELIVSEQGIFTEVILEVEECELLEGIRATKEVLSKGLKQHKRHLRRESKRKKYSFDGIERSNLELRVAIDELQKWLEGEADSSNGAFCDLFEVYQLEGRNGRGRVQTTAYYTPVIEASRTWSKVFQYPIYRKPTAAVWSGKLPTRQGIDGEMKLVARDLEVAWTKSLLDNYFMNLQGSAYMEYADSIRELLVYEGQNGHPYRGVQQYILSKGYVSSVGIDMQNVKQWFKAHPDSIRPILFRNPSYTFFKKSSKAPTGAAGVELTANHSVAVDTRYIPYGSLLLAKLKQGRKTQWRILLPQDKGGAVRGGAHIDVYCGVGEEAVKEARSLKPYGELWLLLPKNKQP